MSHIVFRAFKELLDMSESFRDVTLVLIGSTRNIEDEKLVETLRRKTIELNIGSSVKFVINASYSVLEIYFAIASIGLHTMWNEHFGISVVEMMAAGLIVIGHNSGGPLMDIITPMDSLPTGYLATTSIEYANAMKEILEMNSNENYELRQRSRLASQRYSDSIFLKNIQELFETVLMS